MVILRAPRFLTAAARMLGVFAFMLLFTVSCIGSAVAKTEIQASEYRVKAAFVYKFGDYIEWPTEAFSTPNSPLLIGVVGADALADELVRISSGRTISGRPVIVKKLKYGESLPGSHMIFIGRSNNEQIAAVLDANKERPTLTVTESEDGLKLGSMINMVVVSDKVRFDVALPRAEAGRLKISSRLLAVARKVVVSKP